MALCDPTEQAFGACGVRLCRQARIRKAFEGELKSLIFATIIELISYLMAILPDQNERTLSRRNLLFRAKKPNEMLIRPDLKLGSPSDDLLQQAIYLLFFIRSPLGKIYWDRKANSFYAAFRRASLIENHNL